MRFPSKPVRALGIVINDSTEVQIGYAVCTTKINNGSSSGATFSRVFKAICICLSQLEHIVGYEYAARQCGIFGILRPFPLRNI